MRFSLEFITAWICMLIYEATATDTCCADSWLPYKGSCYLFHDEEKIDWNEANQYCKQKNSNLAEIETMNENLFLSYYSRKLFKKNSNDRNHTVFWMGASDSDIEGIWKWVHKDEELTYTDWDVNQPTHETDNHEDCLGLNGAYDFRWHDGVCHERIGYPLCERKGSSPDSGNSVGELIIG